jgi:hypothetical protein
MIYLSASILNVKKMEHQRKSFTLRRVVNILAVIGLILSSSLGSRAIASGTCGYDEKNIQNLPFRKEKFSRFYSC